MNNADKQPHHPNPALIEKFIDIQEKELVMRAQELELRKQNDNNAHEYAKSALQANVKDRDAERAHIANLNRNRFIFAGVVISFLIAMFCFALFLNKDQIVMEIIKAILFFGTGGFGGYALGKKAPKDNNN